jgi:hypothetical protein
MPGKYQGRVPRHMPTDAGTSEIGAFKYLKDMIWSRI